MVSRPPIDPALNGGGHEPSTLAEVLVVLRDQDEMLQQVIGALSSTASRLRAEAAARRELAARVDGLKTDLDEVDESLEFLEDGLADIAQALLAQRQAKVQAQERPEGHGGGRS